MWRHYRLLMCGHTMGHHILSPFGNVTGTTGKIICCKFLHARDMLDGETEGLHGKQGRRQGGALCVPPPPTFHPLPSLLNVIDFESESETDKTVHIRMRLHALASVSNCTRSQIARLPPPPRHTHTQRDLCPP